MKKLIVILVIVTILAGMLPICATNNCTYAASLPSAKYTNVAMALGMKYSEYFTIALREDSKVWAWGSNMYGQLGNGTTINSPIPTEITVLSPNDNEKVVSVVAGNMHALALKNDGTVWSWGLNTYGQLGNGTTDQKLMPVQVQNLENIISIYAGGNSSYAIKSDGTLWAWGDNGNGKLGINSTTPSSIPVQVNINDIKELYVGSNSAMILKNDGTVWAWGLNVYGTFGNGTKVSSKVPVIIPQITDVKSISVGNTHTTVLKNDGTVWACGDNSYYQLGCGTEITGSNTLMQAVGLYDIEAISSGGSHTLALKDDGTVWAFGFNFYGQIGDGTDTRKTYAVQISGLSKISTIATGTFNSIAISTDGQLYSWGGNDFGQIGDGTMSQKSQPITIDGITNVKSIVGGLYHTSFLKNDGTVWAVGCNSYGQIGDNTTNNTSVIVKVYGLSNVSELVSGGTHMVAIKEDKTVWTWGSNTNGQLGDGTTENNSNGLLGNGDFKNCPYPRQVMYGISNAASIAAGENHTLVAKEDGTVWSWGLNNSGQIGDGTTLDRTTPICITSLSNIKSVYASKFHSAALDGDGNLWAWGYNKDGEVGDGTSTDVTTPKIVLSGVASAVLGGWYSIAVKKDGTVWAWGMNTDGQYGNGTNVKSLIPVNVVNYTNASSIAAGGYHTLMLKKDGTVWSCGNNQYGSLGIKSSTAKNEFNQISGLSDINYIQAGWYHSIAMKRDGTIYVWGQNNFGQLENNDTARLGPVKVLDFNIKGGVSAGPVVNSVKSGNKHAEIRWDSVAGSVYYSVYKSTTPGLYDDAYMTVSGSVYSCDVTALTNGTTYYFVVRSYKDGVYSQNSNEVSATPKYSSHKSVYSAPKTTLATSNENNADNLIKEKVVSVGISTKTKKGDQTVETISLDQEKLEQKLSSGGNKAIIKIPIDSKADVIISELNGKMIKNMEDKFATLEIKTDAATYTLPVEKIKINDILKQIGQGVNIQDIKIQIEISKPIPQMLEKIRDSAKTSNFTILGSPVEFNIRGVYENNSVEINDFDSYVERTITLPDNYDKDKIITGVMVESDATVRHVPTKLVAIDGKYYAKINSMTNSVYTLVWYPLEFNDIRDHWAKDAINNMGSRMIINGVGNSEFEPDRSITRGELAVIIVKALGIQPGNGSNPFTDVKSSDWYLDYIKTAYEYKLISGYENEQFAPMDKVTREQVMTIISRAMDITNLQVSVDSKDEKELIERFNDKDEVADWAKKSIIKAIKAGILSGKDDSIAPKDEITRAEVTVLIQRLLQKSDLI